MKFVFTLLLTLMGLTSIAQYTIKTDSVYISGKIKNYKKYKDTANTVVFTIDDIILGRRVNFQANISNDGTYKIAFLKTGGEDIYIEYNDDLETVIVSPGDHLQVSFDAGNISNTMSFYGDDAQTNRDLVAYNLALDKENIKLYGNDELARSHTLAASEKDAQPYKHKEFLTDRFNKENNYLEMYIKTHKLSVGFVKWIRADLKCEYISNLMRYTWAHVFENKLREGDFKIPDSYFDFVATVPVNNPDLALSSKYREFIHDYALHLCRSPSTQPLSFDYTVAVLAKQPNGLAKDVMLSNAINHLIDAKILQLKPYLDTLKYYVTYAVFYKQTLAACNSAVVQQQNYKLSTASKINDVPKTEADIVFNKILAKYPNKVIYIDFWATWCGPCRADMPNSKALHASFIDKDVVFLYLGLQSEEKTWKALIAELDIKGEHFLLNNNEFATLAKKFRISGVPRYMLVDKAGRISNDNASRPGDSSIKQAISELLTTK